MKKTIGQLLRTVQFLAVLLLCACSPDDFQVESADLDGTWYASDGFYYIFNADASGRCQDVDGYGLDFNWELNDKELTLNYIQNGSIPKPAKEIYHITEFSADMMEAHEIAFPDESVRFYKQ